MLRMTAFPPAEATAATQACPGMHRVDFIAEGRQHLGDEMLVDGDAPACRLGFTCLAVSGRHAPQSSLPINFEHTSNNAACEYSPIASTMHLIAHIDLAVVARGIR